MARRKLTRSSLSASTSSTNDLVLRIGLFTVALEGGLLATVIGGIRLNGDLTVGFPVVKDGGGSEGLLQGVERLPAVIGEVPRDVLPSKAGKRKDDFGVMGNEASIEVGESEEGLDILDFPGLRPVEDGLDLRLRHSESVSGEDVAEVLHGVRVEFALVRAGVELVLPESPEDFLDVLPMILEIIRVDKDVVQIDYNAYVEEVREDLVNEALERRRGVRKSERHH